MLYIVACGGSSTPKKVDAKIVDTKTVDVAVTCAAKSTYSPTFGSGSSQDQYAFDHNTGGSNYTDNVQWQGGLQANPEQFLDLEMYSGGGSGSGGTPDWPTGNVTTKSGIDLATAPDAYIILGANLNAQMQAQDIYLSIAGTLNVTRTSTNLSGTITGLMLQHVDITSTSIDPDPDGCMASIPSMTFNHNWNGSGSAAGPSEGREPQLHTTSLFHD